jgi:hypothetical protein
VTTIDSNAMEFRDSISARAISCYWFGLWPKKTRMLNVTTIDSNVMEFRDSIRARAISCYWFGLWPTKSKVAVQSLVRFYLRRSIGKKM